TPFEAFETQEGVQPKGRGGQPAGQNRGGGGLIPDGLGKLFKLKDDQLLDPGTAQAIGHMTRELIVGVNEAGLNDAQRTPLNDARDQLRTHGDRKGWETDEKTEKEILRAVEIVSRLAPHKSKVVPEHVVKFDQFAPLLDRFVKINLEDDKIKAAPEAARPRL